MSVSPLPPFFLSQWVCGVWLFSHTFPGHYFQQMLDVYSLFASLGQKAGLDDLSVTFFAISLEILYVLHVSYNR